MKRWKLFIDGEFYGFLETDRPELSYYNKYEKRSWARFMIIELL